ncbi:unnamed protein product [Effrenium voratum]|nr:unnamed protein product [Effrenium voratum]|mmetsp:Transcript_87344/g.208944  ORF Transcript_87344/g.208944 Transcript_87344/m.208944 type:complete len:257 (+) Transcript_87344:109-879(+)
MLDAVIFFALAAACSRSKKSDASESQAVGFWVFAASLGATHGVAAVLSLLGFDPVRVHNLVMFVTAAASVSLCVALHAFTPAAQNLPLARFLRKTDYWKPRTQEVLEDVETPPICDESDSIEEEVPEVDVHEETAKVAMPPVPIVDGRTHLHILRAGRPKRLSCISEEVCTDTPKWMAYLGSHLAQEILPRVPLGATNSYENACDAMSSVALWLRSDDAEQLLKGYKPCFGFSCDRCGSAVTPEEQQCTICRMAID